jgi:P-type Cu+ transporter
VTDVAACPSCGSPVDTLRAGQVAILDGAFCYFCDEGCKRAFLTAGPQAAPSEVLTTEPPGVVPREELSAPEVAVAPHDPQEPDDVSESDPPARRPALNVPVASALTRRPTSDSAMGLVQAVGTAGICAGLLVPTLALAGASAAVARTPLTLLALSACVMRVLVVPRDLSDPSPGVGIASLLVLEALAFHDGGVRAGALSSVVGVAAAAHLASAALVDRAREGVRSARAWIAERLAVAVNVVRGDATVSVPADDVRSGETVVATAGETVGVDARVAAGDAVVSPWIDSPSEVTKREGDAIVGGARVIVGSCRVVTTWAGADRAWLRLTCSPSLRPDVAGPFARRVRLFAERGAVLVGVLAGLIAFSGGVRDADLAEVAALSTFLVAALGVSSIAVLHQARGQIAALAHGIVYRDALAFEAAGHVDIAVLCSRSTLLLGAPEIVAQESLVALPTDQILALAAAASAASSHPNNVALAAAAREKGLRPESVRQAMSHPGLGVTAVAPSGERLSVGNRALLLKEKISIALADARAAELEAAGRSVTLVGLGGKLIGLIALLDRLRPGARAAVQRLLDAGIEPVLLSGDARDTCESIGRALDIDHVRPEVLPQDRAGEVRALSEGGHVVAVLGYPLADDGALRAARVSVALGAAGATPGEWSVSLASEDVRDAARALSIAAESRQRSTIAAAVGFVPAGIAVAGVALGLISPAAAPLVALMGLVATVVHARR